MRKIFLNEIAQIIPKEEDTIFFTVDIGIWAIESVLRDYPERCMNVGIYEDGMTSIAAGLSMAGFVPIIFGIQPYIIERNFEQIKMDFAYHKLNGNFIGTGAAVDYSKYGYSHYCPEDFAILKMIPGVEFVAPGTPNQFLKLFRQAYRDGKPTFFRISDHPNKTEIDVELKKATVVRKGNKATIVVVSVLLDCVLEALGDEDVTILYYTTLQPFDSESLVKYFSGGKVLICEPHYEGSILDNVIFALKDNNIQIETVGLPREIFRNYGTYDEKMDFYNINVEGIYSKYKKLVGECD